MRLTQSLRGHPVANPMSNPVNGFLIEMRQDIESGSKYADPEVWIGIARSASIMVAELPRGYPSVLDRGDRVLRLARDLGLMEGEVRRYRYGRTGGLDLAS